MLCGVPCGARSEQGIDTMKVVHVLKRIETIDNDIKELRKIEKTIASNKSFSTPLYLSIEHQINLLLGERVKLFELKISNPPAELAKEFPDKDESGAVKPLLQKSRRARGSASKRDSSEVTAAAAPSVQRSAAAKPAPVAGADDDDELPFRMLTQDQIDRNIDSIKSDSVRNPKDDKLESVKVLDMALESGKIDHAEARKIQEKRKIRFFRDNFPGGDN